MQELFIPTRMPGLNEYSDELRAHRQKGATMKREWTNLVATYAQQARLGHFTEPIILDFHWFEPNRKRDMDNVAFAKKFILDGLKKRGVITDDSCKWVKGFSDCFHYDGTEGVRIVMREVVVENDRCNLSMDGSSE